MASNTQTQAHTRNPNKPLIKKMQIQSKWDFLPMYLWDRETEIDSKKDAFLCFYSCYDLHLCLTHPLIYFLLVKVKELMVSLESSSSTNNI